MFCKKELAGRTMEFTFDVSQTPLIGRRILLKTEEPTVAGATSTTGSSSLNSTLTNATTVTVAPSNIAQQQASAQLQQQRAHTNVAAIAAAAAAAQHQQQQNAIGAGNSVVGTPNSPRRSASLSPADTVPLSGWKRPWMSQCRVRECLVNLLTTCGQRVGLPKSPSVSDSQEKEEAPPRRPLVHSQVHALGSPRAPPLFFSCIFNYLPLTLFLSCKQYRKYQKILKILNTKHQIPNTESNTKTKKKLTRIIIINQSESDSESDTKIETYLGRFHKLNLLQGKGHVSMCRVSSFFAFM